MITNTVIYLLHTHDNGENQHGHTEGDIHGYEGGWLSALDHHRANLDEHYHFIRNDKDEGRQTQHGETRQIK